MARMSGGRAVVESLLAQKVDTVFGLISVHMMGVYDALYDVQDRLRFIGCRHEQAVAYAADGYARATGQPAVCFTSAGPGAANTLGAMGEAYASSSPVLQITSNAERELIDSARGALHEPKDQLGMFRSVTDWNTLCLSVEEVPQAIFGAFHRFKTLRPRPVEIEIATDVIHATGDAEILPAVDYPRGTAEVSRVEEAAELLARAKRPALWAGGGVIASRACAELRSLAELLGAAVVTTVGGKGAFPDDHSHALGCSWGGRVYGQNPLHAFLPSCDVLMAIGTHIPYRMTRGVGVKLPETLIHLDIDPSVFHKNYPARVTLTGDAKAVLGQLLEALQGKETARREGFVREVVQVKKKLLDSLCQQGPNQQRSMDALRQAIPRDALVVWDTTVPAYWASRGFHVYEPRTYIAPHGWGGIGFGFPAALGAKAGRPDRKVVLMSGDGGFQLNLQELGTAVQYGLNVVAVVWNDNAWGVLKDIQRERYQGRFLATELHNPDFVKLAEAYGVRATRVHRLQELVRVLGEALGRDEFHLIEVSMPQGFAGFT